MHVQPIYLMNEISQAKRNVPKRRPRELESARAPHAEQARRSNNNFVAISGTPEPWGDNDPSCGRNYNICKAWLNAPLASLDGGRGLNLANRGTIRVGVLISVRPFEEE